MADLDLTRAKNLLSSAKAILTEGYHSGVAGLTYQAFESACMALLKRINGFDRESHYSRRERAKELLRSYREKIDTLWEIRNIDFYGNITIGKEQRLVTKEESEKALKLVEEMIKEIEVLLRE